MSLTADLKTKVTRALARSEVKTEAGADAKAGTETETEAIKKERLALFLEVVKALDCGAIRVAEPVSYALRESSGPSDQNLNSGWQVNTWIKTAILWGFKYGVLVPAGNLSSNPNFNFFDKDTMLLKQLDLASKVRVAPGGSAIRRGAYLAPGVIMMPPSYINIGAFVGEGSMVDSHVLIGSCAQIGHGVHLAAGVKIGGVLEPAGSLPVIIEDEVFVGGGCGIYEGVVVKTGAVLASGVILNHAIQVYDLPNQSFIKASAEQPLIIPPRAVVVPGTRPLANDSSGVQVSCPVIVKYRDTKTDSSLELEMALRL